MSKKLETVMSINSGIHDGIHSYKLFLKSGKETHFPTQRIAYHKNGLHPNKNYSAGWIIAWGACEKAGKGIDPERLLLTSENADDSILSNYVVSTKQWKFKGITEGHECWDCGKQGLKKVAILENTQTLELIQVGTVCAARMLGYSVPEYRKHITQTARENKEKARREYFDSPEYKLSAFCTNECDTDRFNQIERLIKDGYTRGEAMSFLSAMFGAFYEPAKTKETEVLKKYMVPNLD